MTTLIKTLNITNAELNVITAGRRLPLARFAGKIEIKEIKNITPILGRQCKGEKIIHASFMLCEDIVNIRYKMSSIREKYMKP